MNVFYEEDGSFKVGNVMQSADASMQVEAPHGKRSKIKAANVLLKFEQPSMTEFMERAQALADEIDTQFMWECCAEAEFAFDELAEEYFGHKPSAVEAASVAIRLHSAPMFFYKKGKGRYKAAPEESLKAALAGQERKRLQAEQVSHYAEQLKRHELPENFRPLIVTLLNRPDKNSLEYKALAEAAEAMQTSPLRLIEACGAIPQPREYLFQTFLLDWFPKGVGFAPHSVPEAVTDLPLADVEAFSLDDSSTTEIDDAFSVRPLPEGGWRIGVHIAAPSLGIAVGSDLDKIVMQRLSTVYMPGNKITMLPDDVVERFTLQEGRHCAAVSMYIDIDAELQPLRSESRIEQVSMAANLRNDVVEAYFNDETLASNTDGEYPWKSELRLLWQFACALEKRRGKYDPNRPAQVDYNFRIDGERVDIGIRKRGAPIDKLVAEMMIYVNSEWGRVLGEKGIPGIYRAQQNGKVRMTTNPAPHQGLGVAQYAWSSSPLRRAVDLINQRQLIALLRDEPAPYPKGSEQLFTAIRDFDTAYSAYLEFQDRMERHWCLKWLKQEGIETIGATVLKDGLTVRFEGLPMVAKPAGMPELSQGNKIVLLIGDVDYLTLDIDCRFKEMQKVPSVPGAFAEEEEVEEDITLKEIDIAGDTGDDSPVESAPV